MKAGAGISVVTARLDSSFAADCALRFEERSALACDRQLRAPMRLLSPKSRRDNHIPIINRSLSIGPKHLIILAARNQRLFFGQDLDLDAQLLDGVLALTIHSLNIASQGSLLYSHFCKICETK